MQPPHLDKSGGEIQAGRRGVRTELDRSPQRCDRFVQPSDRTEGISEIVPALAIAGATRDNEAIGLDCTFVVAAGLTCIATQFPQPSRRVIGGRVPIAEFDSGHVLAGPHKCSH
jgi:hypothetical protein